MKTLLIFIILVSVGSVLLVRSYQTPPVTEMVVLRDVTDSLQAQPQSDEIFSFYGLPQNKWGGAIFRFVDLSDVSFNHESEAKLTPANKWLSNEPERSKEIRQFKEEVTKILSAEDIVGRTHSSIYLPLVRELNTLNQSKADRKVLLVYSDLMENSPAISFYNSKTFRLLESNPDSLRNLFEKMQPVNSSNKIVVHLIFQPKDTTQDMEFKVVSEFYKQMLEEKGAQVSISANL